MRPYIGMTPRSVSAVCLVAFAVIMLPDTLPRAGARADECVAKPNAPAPAGQHWWYRTDRATKRKCWFLGPQDKEAAARKADRQDRAAAPTAAPEAAPEPTQDTQHDTQSAPPAAAMRIDTDIVPSFVFVEQESVPYLVDWSSLLEEAGIVSARENALTGWADDNAVRTAWAMRDQSAQAPLESEAGKEDARVAETAAAPADSTGDLRSNVSNDPAISPASAQPGLPMPYIAALLIGGALGPAMIYSIVRTRRQRNSLRRMGWRATDADNGADEGALPGFLLPHDSGSVPPRQNYEQDYEQACGQDDARAHEQEDGRAYGGEEELRRILGLARRRAA